jgi:hypothetical protein
LWKYLETGEVPAGAEQFEKKKFRGAGGLLPVSWSTANESSISDCIGQQIIMRKRAFCSPFDRRLH